MAYIDRDKVLYRIDYLCQVASEPPMDKEDEVKLQLLHKLRHEFSTMPTQEICKNCYFDKFETQ